MLGECADYLLSSLSQLVYKVALLDQGASVSVLTALGTVTPVSPEARKVLRGAHSILHVVLESSLRIKSISPIQLFSFNEQLKPVLECGHGKKRTQQRVHVAEENRCPGDQNSHWKDFNCSPRPQRFVFPEDNRSHERAMTTHEEHATIPFRSPSYWQASSDMQALIRMLDPILPLINEVRPDRDGPDVFSLQVSAGKGEASANIMVQLDLLTLDMYVGDIPATAENYATLLAHHREGPWWYRIDDVGSDGMAIVIRMCSLHRQEVARLDRWVLEILKEYWTAQPILEVLNGSFDDH